MNNVSIYLEANPNPNSLKFVANKILLKDKYDSIKKIGNINFPKMVMHGDKDKIVPFSMGKEMFEKFSEPKLSYFRKGDDHMMEFDEELLEKIKNFLKII